MVKVPLGFLGSGSLATGSGVGVGVAVGLGVAVGVGVAVGPAVGVGVAVGLGVAVGVAFAQAKTNSSVSIRSNGMILRIRILLLLELSSLISRVFSPQTLKT